MLSTFLWIYLVSSVSISHAEIPTSVCLQHKPFKSKDGTCLNFNDVCLKNDDVECKAFLSACSQCPLTNNTFIGLLQLLNSTKAEYTQKFVEVENKLDKMTVQQRLAYWSNVKHDDQHRILLIIILILLFILLIFLLVEIRFKLITKVMACNSKRNKNVDYHQLESRKYEENMYIYDTVMRMEGTLNSFVTQFETRLNEMSEQISKDRSTNNIPIIKTKFKIKDLLTPIQMSVNSDDNVVKLKKEICTKYQKADPNAYKIMKFKYNGTTLDDNQYLLSCIPSPDVVIDCVMSEKGNASDTVVVKLDGNRRVPKLIQINKQESIAQLKTIISKLSSTNDFMLFHENKELDNESTLEKCALNDDDVIKVIAREQGEFIINFIFDRESMIIKYSNVDRVSQLKQQILKNCAEKDDELILFTDNRYMDDEKLIFDYDISYKDRISCWSIKGFNVAHLPNKPIATGCMSEVFQTTEPSTGRSTIVKKYQIGSMDQFKRSGALLNELKRFQCTKSNSTFVKLLGIYFHDTSVFVVMENTEGESMKDYLKDHHPIQNIQMAKWAKQILEGLKHLHCNGQYYRDLKATDIILDKTNNVKISGFGLSKYILGIDSQNMLEGVEMKNTSLIRLAAPELMTNQPVGTFTDVWSFGAILYRMVTNKAPYSNMNYNDVMKKISNNDNIEHDDLGEDVNPKLKALLHRCLKGKPENRATVNELLQDEFITDCGP